MKASTELGREGMYICFDIAAMIQIIVYTVYLVSPSPFRLHTFALI